MLTAEQWMDLPAGLRRAVRYYASALPMMHLDCRDTRVTIAKRGQEICGLHFFVIYATRPHVLESILTYVPPRFRKTGAGLRLWKHTLSTTTMVREVQVSVVTPGGLRLMQLVRAALPSFLYRIHECLP